MCLSVATCVAARKASMKKTAVSVKTCGPSSLCSSELTVIDRYSMKRPSRYCVGTSHDFLQNQVPGGIDFIRTRIHRAAKKQIHTDGIVNIKKHTHTFYQTC